MRMVSRQRAIEDMFKSTSYALNRLRERLEVLEESVQGMNLSSRELKRTFHEIGKSVARVSYSYGSALLAPTTRSGTLH